MWVSLQLGLTAKMNDQKIGFSFDALLTSKRHPFQYITGRDVEWVKLKDKVNLLIRAGTKCAQRNAAVLPKLGTPEFQI